MVKHEKKVDHQISQFFLPVYGIHIIIIIIFLYFSSKITLHSIDGKEVQQMKVGRENPKNTLAVTAVEIIM